jgi:hypothetical protein
VPAANSCGTAPGSLTTDQECWSGNHCVGGVNAPGPSPCLGTENSSILNQTSTFVCTQFVPPGPCNCQTSCGFFGCTTTCQQCPGYCAQSQNNTNTCYLCQQSYSRVGRLVE